MTSKAGRSVVAPGEFSAAVVFLDLDGTLLTPDHEITPRTATAVRATIERGTHVVLASSRSPVGLRPIQAELGLLGHWFVCFQGALIGRWNSDHTIEILRQTPLDNAQARMCERLATEHGLVWGRYRGLDWLVPVVDDVVRVEAGVTGETPVVAEDLESAEGPHKVMVMADPLTQLPALEALFAGIPGTVAKTYSGKHLVEITSPGVDKATGVRAVAEHLGLDPARAAAVGDGFNDLAMLHAVGYPVAMAHAAPEIRAAARWTTTTNTEDGVARVLEGLRPATRQPHLARSRSRGRTSRP